MTHKKRLIQTTLLVTLLCGVTVLCLHSQEAGGSPPRPPHGPPPSPLFDALDTNHDGVISADEIANASTSLKTLLKNGATQITRDDVRPPHPPIPRDDPGDSHPRPERKFSHFHRPPPPDVQSENEQARPRFSDLGDRPDRPRHQPPARRVEDRESADEMEHPRRGPVDREDRPPRRENADMATHPHPQRGEDVENAHHHPPAHMPLFDALDANHDGVISTDEITSAPEALKKLDKSGSGQIKREDLEFLPPTQENGR